MSGFADIEVSASGDYVKLVAGNPVTIHILSREPSKEIVHWKNKEKVVCFGDKGCALCAEGNKAKQRWLVEVWDRNEKKVKKFEFGAMIASQIKAIAELMAESQKTVHDIDLRIKTTGSSLETEYSVLHIPMSGEIPLDVTERFVVPF